VLLALLDEDGTVDARATNWSEAFAAGALAELALRGRVGLKAAGGGLLTVDRGNDESEDDDVLDRVLRTMRRFQKTASLAYWTAALAADGALRRRTAERLADRGILAVRRRGSIPFFRWKAYPTADRGPEAAMRARLVEAVCAKGPAADARTRALCALVVVGDLAPSVTERAGDRVDARVLARTARSSRLGRAILDAVAAIRRAREDSLRAREETLATCRIRRFGRW